jgi:hypothetical protein
MSLQLDGYSAVEMSSTVAVDLIGGTNWPPRSPVLNPFGRGARKADGGYDMFLSDKLPEPQ